MGPITLVGFQDPPPTESPGGVEVMAIDGVQVGYSPGSGVGARLFCERDMCLYSKRRAGLEGAVGELLNADRSSAIADRPPSISSPRRGPRPA